MNNDNVILHLRPAPLTIFLLHLRYVNVSQNRLSTKEAYFNCALANGKFRYEARKR